MVLLPVDVYADCMDVWELVCSARGLSTDKTQRLVILGLREFRQLGIIRALVHVPTNAMLAESMTEKYFRVSAFARRVHIEDEDLECHLPNHLDESLHAPLH